MIKNDESVLNQFDCFGEKHKRNNSISNAEGKTDVKKNSSKIKKKISQYRKRKIKEAIFQTSNFLHLEEPLLLKCVEGVTGKQTEILLYRSPVNSPMSNREWHNKLSISKQVHGVKPLYVIFEPRKSVSFPVILQHKSIPVPSLRNSVSFCTFDSFLEHKHKRGIKYNSSSHSDNDKVKDESFSLANRLEKQKLTPVHESTSNFQTDSSQIKTIYDSKFPSVVGISKSNQSFLSSNSFEKRKLKHGDKFCSDGIKLNDESFSSSSSFKEDESKQIAILGSNSHSNTTNARKNKSVSFLNDLEEHKFENAGEHRTKFRRNNTRAIKKSLNSPNSFQEQKLSTKIEPVSNFHPEGSKVFNEFSKSLEKAEQNLEISQTKASRTVLNSNYGKRSKSFPEDNRNNVKHLLPRIQNKKSLSNEQVMKKIYRTSLKRINITKIVNSLFKNVFHHFALLGGRLKSGAVITKANSNHWLRNAGLLTDASALRIANERFSFIAGKKVVLNIYDYVKFLNLFARWKQIIMIDLIQLLIGCKLPSFKELNKSLKAGTAEFSCYIYRCHSAPDLSIGID